MGNRTRLLLVIFSVVIILIAGEFIALYFISFKNAPNPKSTQKLNQQLAKIPIIQSSQNMFFLAAATFVSLENKDNQLFAHITIVNNSRQIPVTILLADSTTQNIVIIHVKSPTDLSQ